MWINFDQLLDLSNVTVVNVRRSGQENLIRYD